MAGAGMIFGLAVLLLLSRKEKVALPEKKLLVPFYRGAQYMVRTFNRLSGQKLFRNQVKEDLVSLSLSNSGPQALLDYYVKKGALLMMILFAVGLLSLSTGLSKAAEGADLRQVRRNSPGQGAVGRSYIVDVEGTLERYPMALEIQERKLSKEELSELFDKLGSELEQAVLRENASADYVTGDLYFPATLAEGAVKVEWDTDHYELVNMDGSINQEKTKQEGTPVRLTATLSYGEERMVYDFYVNVFPPQLSPEEQAARALEDLVAAQEREQGEAEYFTLPDQVDGRAVTWSPEKQRGDLLIAVFGIVVAVLVFFGKDQDLHKAVLAQRQQMALDYPEIASKLTLLLSAGMTVSGAWKKIAYDYKEKQNARQGEKRYAYEQMLVACYEMQDGMSEFVAYDNFGRRCKSQRYIKFIALLTQNVKKGTKDLTRVLEYEVRDAFEERKSLAKRIGEEAGTKLLMPMMLMLAVVLVVIVVPAFLSLNIS